METIEKLETIYTMEDEFLDDWKTDEHLQFLINQRFEKVKINLEEKNFYSLKIIKVPTRTNYHLFSFENLQEVSRKLTNGLISLGSITNRQFWNKYFLGGVRTISVSQDDTNEYPSFTLNYLLYSDFDNLDVRIIKNLTIRIKSIDPTLTFQLQYLGKYKTELVSETIPTFKEIDFQQELIDKLGIKTIESIDDLRYQRPRFLGRLFKTI